MSATLNPNLFSPTAVITEIPLVGASQVLTVTLSGVTYIFTIVWQDAVLGGYFLNITDSVGNQLVNGIALVTGIDLLEPYQYLGIGGSLYVATDGQNPYANPTYDNLGTSSHLYYVTAS